MPSHNLKKIYARPTRVQDLPFIATTIAQSRGRLTQIAYVPYAGKWEAWYHEDEFLSFMQDIADAVRAPSWSLAEHLGLFPRAVERVKQSVSALARASASSPAEELLAAYRAYLASWADYVPFIWTPWAITYVLDDWFAEQLKLKFPDGGAMYEALAVSTRPIQMQQCIEALLEWKIHNGAAQELEALRQTFGHLGGYSVNHLYWTTEELLVQIKEFPYPADDLARMRREREEARARVEDVYAQLARDPALLNMAKLIHEYIYLRTERIDQYKWALMNAAPFYRALEQRFGLLHGSAADLTNEEVARVLETGAAPADDELARRATQYIYIFTRDNATEIISDPEQQKKWVAQHLPVSDGRVAEVRGRVAYQGKVQGVARVIVHVHDVSAMHEGEILISNMTHPDYMSAIYKARGIVTDEGGIVCHAAIISRELKIPCVIGTGDATKIFKTGDRVEVDAEAGVVRRI